MGGQVPTEYVAADGALANPGSLGGLRDGDPPPKPFGEVPEFYPVLGSFAGTMGLESATVDLPADS